MSSQRRLIWVWVLCAAVLAALSFAAYGQCATLGPYIDNCSGANCGSQTGLTGGLGSTIIPYFWISGSASTYNSSPCTAGQDAFKKSGGQYQVLSSWGTNDSGGGKINCAFGCPSPTGTRLIFVYSNQATGNGDGSYILMSVLYNSNSDSRYNFYSIANGSGTPANNCATIALPAVTISSVTPVGGGYSVTFTWPSIYNGSGFNQLRGYYDSDPGSNLLTGIRIRYATGATAPTSDLSNYPNIAGTLNVSSSATDPGTATFTVPGPISTATWFRIFLVFDNNTTGYETLWGGPVSGRIGPTPAGIFAREEARLKRGQVSLTWRSNVETNVAYYEACYATRASGPFDPVPGALTRPQGADHEYCLSFPVPARSSKVFLKVRAVLYDGSQEWSGLLKVKPAAQRSFYGE